MIIRICSSGWDGEKVVPYGSWHISGALMDRPLARLRGDLRALGFARTPQTREPEDHAGALCETMAMLAADDSALSFAAQKKFFDAHAAPWLGGFFRGGFRRGGNALLPRAGRIRRGVLRL